MASTEYDLNLNIRAKNQASAELDKVSKSTENLQKQSFQWSKSTESALKKVGATATVVAGSMIALGKSFIDASIENEPLQRSFERLSESAGIASDEMLKAMRKASKGTVADTQLMASANKAYSLGIVSNVEDMTTMMEIARVKGQAMGRTMEEALDDIVTGLGRGSVQILDNLGIVIKQSEAQEIYAKQLGKTVEELTEAEKKQALVNAVVSQGKKELEEAGEVQLTMQERLAQVNTQRENLKNTLGDALIPIFEKILGVVTPIIEKVVNWIEENPKLSATIFTIITAVSGLIAVFSGLALALPTIMSGLALLSGPIGRVIAGVTALGLAWTTNFGGIREKTAEVTEKISNIIQPRLQKIQERRDKNGEAVKEIVGGLRDGIKNMVSAGITLLGGLLESFFQALDVLIKVFSGDWEGAWEGICNIAETRVTTMDEVLTEAFGGTRQSIKDGVQGVLDWMVEKFNAIINTVKNAVSTIKDAWNSAKDSVSNFASNTASKVSNFFGGGKAEGGTVHAGTTYLVGEQGPELFVPATTGTIIPNNEIVNNNGITINMTGVSIRQDSDITALAQEITRLAKLERNYGIN